MKKTLQIILIISCIFNIAFALKKDEIKAQMSSKIDSILIVLAQKNLTNEKKGEKIVSIIDKVFDYKVMAKIALGKSTWKSISIEQKKEFIQTFERKLKQSYIEKLELYDNQKVKILDLVPYKNTRLQLQSELMGKDENYQINYNFYKNKSKDEWFIYDVDLVGVSIIQTYRQQFSGLLKEKTFDELLQSLKNSLK